MGERHLEGAPAHGRRKEAEGDDPLALAMVTVPADPQTDPETDPQTDPRIMASCLIEEFASLGLGREEIFELFRSSEYQTHHLYVSHGEVWTRRLIDEVLGRCGAIRTVVRYAEGGDDGAGS